jgi:transposase
MSAEERERRRRLAVERVNEGWTQQAVAQFLGIAKSTVCGWMKSYRVGGAKALRSRPHTGRPRKLSAAQERSVLSWFSRSPMEFGFANELWTASRVAQLIRKEWKICFHPRYLNQWLAERRITPQKPYRQPRERDEKTIRHWARYTWPRLKNERGRSART